MKNRQFFTLCALVLVWLAGCAPRPDYSADRSLRTDAYPVPSVQPLAEDASGTTQRLMPYTYVVLSGMDDVPYDAGYFQDTRQQVARMLRAQGLNVVDDPARATAAVLVSYSTTHTVRQIQNYAPRYGLGYGYSPWGWGNRRWGGSYLGFGSGFDYPYGTTVEPVFVMSLTLDAVALNRTGGPEYGQRLWNVTVNRTGKEGTLRQALPFLLDSARGQVGRPMISDQATWREPIPSPETEP